MMVQECQLPSSHPIAGIASLGAHGNSATHAERDLHKWMDVDSSLCLPTHNIKIRIANPNGEGVVEADHAVLMPVDVVREAHEHGPEVYNRVIVGTQGDTAMYDFWKNSNSKQDWVQRHPHVGDESTWYTTVPVWLHGDMARIYKVMQVRTLLKQFVVTAIGILALPTTVSDGGGDLDKPCRSIHPPRWSSRWCPLVLPLVLPLDRPCFRIGSFLVLRVSCRLYGQPFARRLYDVASSSICCACRTQAEEQHDGCNFGCNQHVAPLLEFAWHGLSNKVHHRRRPPCERLWLMPIV